jgi:conjugative relaxase-like TrwC/TraI family protein
MLGIQHSVNAAAAKDYFTTGLARQDYYSAGQTVTGQWHGQGARLLGLSGEVTKEQFGALADNLRLDTGERLTLRQKDNRRPGYDFTFSAPKSVSLLYGLTGDARINTAMESAVTETMREVEADMQTRVRKGGAFDNRTTGNLVWAAFTHEMARPVGGVPDPQLHVHAYVFNATFDPEERAWKAIEIGDIKRQASYYEAAFHARLAASMRDLGFEIRQNGKFWDLAALSPETVNLYSRRTRQVEREAARRNIIDPWAKAQIGKMTREGKAGDLTGEANRAEWWNRLTRGARREVNRAIATLQGGGDQPPPRTPDARRRDVQAALTYAVAHSFERKSSVAEKELLAQALRFGQGRVLPEQVRRAVQWGNAHILSAVIEGQRMVTTREVLEEEKAMLAWAQDTRRQGQAVTPLGVAAKPFRSARLNEGQQQAVRHVLESPYRLMMIRGGAGKGKSTLMQEAAKEIERSSGKRIFAFAPGTRGVEVLRKEGFRQAQTVAHLLQNEVLQRRLQGNVLWVDEAGQLGVQDMNRLFALADRTGCRLLLSGDPGQHTAVQRGDAMRLLGERGHVQSAVLTDILRQRGDYKEAVALIEQGKIVEGFRRFDALGWVVEAPDDVRHKLVAEDYAWYTRAGERVLVVAPTHAEGRKVTAAIREALRQDGRLGPVEQTVTSLRNLQWTGAEKSLAAHYRPGMVVQFVQHARGITSGERFEVVSVDGERVMLQGRDGTPRLVPLPLATPSRFNVYEPVPLALAEGDTVRITQNGKSADGRMLNNGAFYTVKSLRADRSGTLTGILLSNGAILRPDFGHLTHGYYTTSHGSQGETVDRILIAEGAESLPAASREQFYVSVSRGRTAARIYTDDKQALLARIQDTSHRLSAVELMAGEGTARGKPAGRGTDRHRQRRRAALHARLAESERAQLWQAERTPALDQVAEQRYEGRVYGSGMER